MEQAKTSIELGWEAVPGPILFTLLTIVATGFILLPSESTDSYAHRLTRFSPFACLYDIIEQMVRIGATTYDRQRHSTLDDTFDIRFRFDATRTYIDPVIRLAAVVSLLALFQLRNALWTQILAVLYMVHWAGTCALHVQWAEAQKRTQTIERTSGVLLAVICQLALGVSTAQGSRGWHSPLSAGIILGIAAGVAYVFASTSGQGVHVTYGPLISQPAVLFWLSLAWWKAFSQGDATRDGVPEDAAATEETVISWLAPPACFQMAICAFLLFRKFVDAAHPGVKAVAGGVWIAFGAMYYCWLYESLAPHEGGRSADEPS